MRVIVRKLARVAELQRLANELIVVDDAKRNVDVAIRWRSVAEPNVHERRWRRAAIGAEAVRCRERHVTSFWQRNRHAERERRSGIADAVARRIGRCDFDRDDRRVDVRNLVVRARHRRPQQVNCFLRLNGLRQRRCARFLPVALGRLRYLTTKQHFNDDANEKIAVDT